MRGHFDSVGDVSHVYKQITCRRRNLKDDEGLSKACFRDLTFYESPVCNTNSMARAYLTSLAHQSGQTRQSNQVDKRAILTAFMAGALVGGVTYGVLPTIFSKQISNQHLEDEGAETERILSAMDSRVNVLDQNQEKLTVMINDNKRSLRILQHKSNLHEMIQTTLLTSCREK